MGKTADTRLRRAPERGGRDFATACRIIDAARICHVGFVVDGLPYVVPMACARRGAELLLHASTASRLAKALAAGAPCCVTVTHLDGLVLARSAFHSSMNYRSVMVFGQARVVEDPQEKLAGLDALVEHLLPGRMAELRPHTRREIAATALLALPIQTFTTKMRSGPPNDPAADLDQPVWAGVVPLRCAPGEPETAPDLRCDEAPPKGLREL
jgi:nitroimidazol reductase NimA-like FMN-containing flavoprotein (pyridoxamine 5'-phosphate oxidase superfamily)